MLNLLPMKRKTVKGKRVLFEKEAIRKKPTWNAKKKSLQRLVHVMSCLNLGGRETREYVHDEWRICAGCREKTWGYVKITRI